MKLCKVYAVTITGYIDAENEDEARKIAYGLRIESPLKKFKDCVRFKYRSVGVTVQEEP
jgi:hypothetical protein